MHFFRKITLSVALLVMATLSFAQTNGSSSPIGEQNGVYFDGLFGKDDAGFSITSAHELNVVPGSFVFGMDILNHFSSNTRWGIRAGYQYRCWLVDKLFLEGRLTIGVYDENITTVNDGKTSTKTGAYTCMQINPNVGFLLSNRFGVSVGYHYELNREYNFAKAGIFYIF